MSKQRRFPPGLPPEISKPLLAVADQIRALEPWKTISDSELIGLRDDTTGELQIASVLGTLGTVFAVVIYRRERGLRWIYRAALSDEVKTEHDLDIEDMDCLKVEWTKKAELKQTDLETLAAAQYKPKGKGSIWPRFQLCEPGWYPWYLGPLEARLFTEQLKKVLRFLHLRARVPDLRAGHLSAEVPIIPAGDEPGLTQEQLEWLPLVPGPEDSPAPLTLSADEQTNLNRLPTRDDLVFEFVAPLVPAISFWDERADRPCLGRACILIDRYSHFIFETQLAHGPELIHLTAKPVLIQGLLKAKVRPRAIHVAKKAHLDLLREPCQALGISVVMAERLDAADDALGFLVEHFRKQTR